MHSIQRNVHLVRRFPSAALGIASVLMWAVLAAVPSFAGNGTLTNEMAEHALNQWNFGNGSKGVVSIQEIPAQNTARIEFILAQFKWEAPKNDAVTAYALGPGGGEHIYNGKATAIFVHYTDGRWVLKRVNSPMGYFGDLDIEAN